MKWPWSRKSEGLSPRKELEDSLTEVKFALSRAYAGFNTAADSELVESYIYEIQALQTRYSYLLRQRKALEAAPGAARGPARPRRGVHDPLPVA